MGQIGTSHVAPDTIDKFGSCLEMLREVRGGGGSGPAGCCAHPARGGAMCAPTQVFLAEDGQPFILSASGSLGWDFFAVNFVEAGENVLVINTGYFGDSFANCCAAYGANVTQLGAPVRGAGDARREAPPSRVTRCVCPIQVGAQPSLAEIEAALSGETRFKMVTITHVDTSTGVLTDAKVRGPSRSARHVLTGVDPRAQGIAETVRRLQPDALIAVDGVCSLAGEELRMQSWDIDMAMTGSQKALGVPPGLCLMVVRPRAMAVYEARTTPVASYYAALKHWLPIMKVPAAAAAHTPAHAGSPWCRPSVRAPRRSTRRASRATLRRLR